MRPLDGSSSELAARCALPGMRPARCSDSSSALTMHVAPSSIAAMTSSPVASSSGRGRGVNVAGG
jgi:hypothetical protein